MSDTYFFAADLGYRSDSSAALLLKASAERFIVTDIREWKPSKGSPLVPSVVRAGMIEMAKSAGCKEIALDLFGVEDAREQFSKERIAIFELPNGQAGKLQMYSVAKELIHAKRVRIPAPHRRLATQVKAVIGKPTPGGGLQISSPRTPTGGHGDLCSAFIAALYLAHVRSGSQVTRLSPHQISRLAQGGRWGGMGRRGFG
jgi:hypothetical protein